MISENARDLICKSVCEIVNQSLIQGIFPDDWNKTIDMS